MLPQVDGRVLPDASLQYANSTCVDVNNQGQWRASGRATLVNPVSLSSWAVLNAAPDRCSSTGVSDFVQQVMSAMRQQGMQVQPPAMLLDTNRFAGDVAAAFDHIAAAASGEVQLVLVVLPAKSSSLYQAVKQAAGQRGIVTQCVVGPGKARIQGDAAGTDPAYLGNLLCKLNAKLVSVVRCCAVGKGGRLGP